MDKLHLIKPDITYKEQIAAYRKEFLEINSSLDGCGSLMKMGNPMEWLQQCKDCEKKETVPEGWVEATQYILVREADNRLLGMIQIRHYFNEFLEKYGGHIGYSVRPSERRKGYAKQMLKMSLPYCKEVGLNKVLITCKDENEGSRKTILANGGIYESTVVVPDDNVKLERYWIEL
jgi:predicted acetyltransferase